MAERDSGWVSGGVLDAEDARLATAALAAPGAGPIQARTGIRPTAGNPGLVRATSTPSGSVTVEPFQAIIQGTRFNAAGAYLATLDTVKTINVLADPPHATNPRRDFIVAVQSDTQYGDQGTALEIRRVLGTPGNPPTDPALPADHVKLAVITVPAGATTVTTSNILDLRTYTTAAGGVLPVANRGARPSPAYPGQVVYVQDIATTEISDGAAWYPVARGGLAIYGPSDAGWPVTASIATPVKTVINKTTVPAVPYPRRLLVTGHTMITYAAHSGRYDLAIEYTGGSAPAAIVVIQPGSSDGYNSATVSGIVNQPANTPLAIDLTLRRAGGNGAVSAGQSGAYTSTNVLAIPV